MSYNSKLANLSGYWTATKNIHIIQSNKKYTYKEHLQFIKCPQETPSIPHEIYNLLYYSDKHINYYYHNRKKVTENYVENISKQIDLNYIIENNSKNYTKFKYLKNKIQYEEYIYIINQNLQISIAIIKKLNQYIAIVFTSYIKKLQND